MMWRDRPATGGGIGFEADLSGDAGLRAMAATAGISASWKGNDGVDRPVAPDVLRATLQALGLPCATNGDRRDSLQRLAGRAMREVLPPLVTARCGEPVELPMRFRAGQRFHLEYEHGVHRDGVLFEGSAGAAMLPAIERPGYHRLTLDAQNVTIAAAPARCWTFADVGGGARMWGLSAQTYALHARDDLPSFGIGNFGNLGELAERAAHAGGDALMMSPCHALFHADPRHISPYSPSSRFAYNGMLADPAEQFPAERLQLAVRTMPEELASLAHATGALIDWESSTRARQAFLRALYDDFLDKECSQNGNAIAASFDRFKRDGGEILARHALFETLHALQFGSDREHWHWRTWPKELREPSPQTLASLTRRYGREIDYHIFLQWLAQTSLQAAHDKARLAGMRTGLIADLAVGVSDGGSHAWSRPAELLHGLSIGAPPDALAPRGQNWGLTTFSPFALADTGYEGFLATLRACLTPAGGVRIDHVMGLQRLWLIPAGGSADDGAYVSYPFEDLIRLVALESWRQKKVVIGEDLGTVPEGLRERAAENGLSGMRVLLFERGGDGYRPPGHYKRQAMTLTTTHDTATLIGWRRGSDIDLRERLDQLPPGQTGETARRERERDVRDLEHMFAQSGLAPAASGYLTPGEAEGRFAHSSIAFAASTPAQFICVPLEDISGEAAQPNLPGTVDEHPNWRRRYSKPVEAMFETWPGMMHAATLRQFRPKS
ncbi:MAG: 4-alpha-glucanotransferase [Beijerinckiaceae bacterium]